MIMITIEIKQRPIASNDLILLYAKYYTQIILSDSHNPGSLFILFINQDIEK